MEKRLVLKKSDDKDNERKELVNHNKLFFCQTSINAPHH
ncbi:hypothetical protein CHCC14817_3505 [Bacillus paralicheniformis]|nr:hypothetical protein SC10_B2orf02773 [Bacillus paralicheniformis]TWJ62476.1 hypothetical protein CHCC5021_1943 [Bacillus paralicheniformis]TWL09281.1 hypothetical protein CHCC19468_1492 [Bacillus paralicheniformis]TWL45047.1 hypothetical protein CHCC15337_2913 [Bacillus paralicheniformis]TWM49629.1 hypothetical protein CHCC14817_3505 [Bacillus paralicheniformis]